MHIDPRQVPADLKEPAMDAGYPPDTDDVERCTWCQRGGEMSGFEGLPFCDEDCANAYWWEWGY